MRYAFAGDRAISCTILKFLIGRGFKPQALFVTEGSKSTHAQELIDIADLKTELVFIGKAFQDDTNIAALKDLNLDYIFGIHFPYLIPHNVLDIPRTGFLNLHPAYLPYNKGWHTPSWAIMDKTPYGATLHFMSDGLDEGDIVHQKILPVSLSDTANTLYSKVLELEKEVFLEAFEDLVKKIPKRTPQHGAGTAHKKRDLESVQKINLDEKIGPLELIDKLRGLTTNKKSEAAFFVMDGKKITVQVELCEIS